MHTVNREIGGAQKKQNKCERKQYFLQDRTVCSSVLLLSADLPKVHFLVLDAHFKEGSCTAVFERKNKTDLKCSDH